MKCIVFSDAHGDAMYMKRALMKNKDAEVVFFLGDGLNDFDYAVEAVYDKSICKVLGNCDIGYSLIDNTVGKTDEITLSGKKIVYTHGDLYNVKYDYCGLVRLAILRGADIVLFGHTHSPLELYVPCDSPEYMNIYNELKDKGVIGEEIRPKSIYIVNPGSISYRGGDLPSYALVTIQDNAVLISHGREY